MGIALDLSVMANWVIRCADDWLRPLYDTMKKKLITYETEQRYQKMVREHKDYAELIYDYLVEAGTDLYNNLFSSLKNLFIQRLL